MLRILASSVAFLCLAAAASSQQEPNRLSERPFDDRRVVSPSGQYYAVLTARRGYWPGTFELRRRRAGVEPLAGKTSSWLRDAMRPGLGEGKTPGPLERLVDAADELLARRVLPQLPVEAFVLDDPLGLLLFDHHAEVGYGSILALLDAEGRTRWSVTLDDLYGGEPEGTWHTPNSRAWCDGFGLDPERATFWVASLGHAFREVDLRSGRVRVPDAEALAGACTTGTEASRHAALDALLRRPGGVPTELAAQLAALAADERRPLRECLRAAVAARRAGDDTSRRELFEEALGVDDAADQRFAATWLQVVEPGMDPLPGLRTALQRLDAALDPRPFTWQFQADPHLVPDLRDAAARAGDAAREALLRWAADETATLDFRVRAATLWWMRGGAGLPEGLEAHLLRSADPLAAEQVLEALLRAQPAGMAELFGRLLAEGSADDARLASWFVDHPSARAVDGLQAAKGRSPADSDDREVFDAALRACSR